MKSVVLRSDQKLHYIEAPKPTPRHGEVLVRVRACGICGSDLRYLEGENPWSQQTLGYATKNPDNMIIGHEFAGDVVEIADEKDRHLLGKKVAALVYNTCETCELCRTNAKNLCKSTKHIGHGAGWEEMDYYPGGMAEYCQVWSDHVYTFESDMSYEEASAFDFVGVGLAAVNKAPKVLSEDAVIIGAGPVGLAMVQILKLKGARRVYCVDVLDYAFDVALKTGADGAYNSSKVDAKQEILAVTNGLGCAMVFDTVGTPETQKLGIALLKPRGILVNLVCNTNEVEYELRDLSAERSIISVANCSYEEYYDTIRLMDSGRIDVRPLITDVLPLSEALDGFDRLFNRESTGSIKVVLKP